MSGRAIKVLEKYGPMLSGELARRIEEDYGVSNTTARQILSRAKKPVNKIATLSFTKNQKFFYLESQYMKQKYAESLMKAIEKDSMINWIYIRAFQNQYGYVSKGILPALVAAPVKNVKGHKKHERIIQDLLKCNIIEEADEEHWKLCDWVPAAEMNAMRSTGIEVVKKQIVHDFAGWARNINMVGYDSAKTLFEEAEFANFQWAFSAPSYVQPLYNMQLEKNGFVVADVFYGKTADVEDIRFFLDKISIIRRFKKLPVFLPILLVESVTPEALAELKKHKVLIALIRNLFDEKYTELLADIVNIFTHASAIVSKNPTQIDKLFAEIAKADGKFNDIVGDLFELMVGYYYYRIGSSFLMIGRKIRIPDSEKTNELDVLVQRDGKMIVVECKAKHSMIDAKFVQTWLNKNIPQTRKWLLNQYTDYKNMEFQLWALGGFTPEAEQLLKKAVDSAKKYKIEYLDRNQVMQRFREGNVQHAIDLLNQYFRK